MQVFISWSGEKSQLVAVELHSWFKSVIQAVQPFVSSEDVAKGGRWSPEIAGALEASDFGVICVTSENHDRPWLNFEAGALSKSVSAARVAPILIDVRQSDIEGPLGQFQSTYVEREDMLKLMLSMNRSIGEPGVPLDESELRRYFDTWWPKLELKIREINEKQRPTEEAAKRTNREVLDELLENSRTMLRNTQRTIGYDATSALLQHMQIRDAEKASIAATGLPAAQLPAARLAALPRLLEDTSFMAMLSTDKTAVIRLIAALFNNDAGGKAPVSIDDRGDQVIVTFASPPTTKALRAVYSFPDEIGGTTYRFRLLRPDGGYYEYK
jgi:hypothetical protein